MADEDQFSTDFAREHRTLEVPLRERAGHAFRLLDRVPVDRLLALSTSDIADEILEDRGGGQDAVGSPTPIATTPLPLIQDLARPAELRGETFEQHIPCWRWELRFGWTGATDLFGRWPDRTGTGLAIFENHPQRGAPPTIKWRRAEGLLIATCFCPRTPASDAIDVEVDAALADAWEAEQTTRPDELFGVALKHVKAYCDAVNEQVDDWGRTLREDLLAEIDRRRRLAHRGRADRERVEQLLQEWRVEPLHLAAEPPVPVVPPVTTPLASVTLAPPLADSSLVDIVRVINRWVDAIEKYVAAFIELEEERVSDLLVATLNGAFGRAEREVFIGGGKSDFYVQATTFGLDGNADIFVGELKFWDGEQTLIQAVDQSLNNLTQRTRSAVLVILVRDRESFADAVQSGEAALLADTRIIEREPNLAERPSCRAMSALDPNAFVRLVVIFVDLTRPTPMLPKPKGRRRRSRTNAPSTEA